MTGVDLRTPEITRLLRHVVKTETCWLWAGTRTGGYGNFHLAGKHGPTVRPHRFSYEHFVAPIPDGQEIHHTCGNKLCVNPAHMQSITRPEHARLHPSALKTHCVHGHEFTVANTYRKPKNGRRECLTCKHARNRRAA